MPHADLCQDLAQAREAVQTAFDNLQPGDLIDDIASNPRLDRYHRAVSILQGIMFEQEIDSYEKQHAQLRD